MSKAAGTLFCVATPIGNIRDITLRAIDVLKDVPFIACEDTRTAGRLLARLDVKGPKLISLFEHNEARRVNRLLKHLESGDDVALVSEAGTPTISDPGYRLVSACLNAGILVVPLPGACAVTAALSASGLPTDKFLFLGFPPKKGAKLSRFLDRATGPECTSVVYLPTRRLAAFLQDVAARVPEAKVVVARELTKVYEEFLRGTAAELAGVLQDTPVKGECTLLIYVPKAR